MSTSEIGSGHRGLRLRLSHQRLQLRSQEGNEQLGLGGLHSLTHRSLSEEIQLHMG